MPASAYWASSRRDRADSALTLSRCVAVLCLVSRRGHSNLQLHHVTRFTPRFWHPRTLVHGARERLAAMTVVCTARNNDRQVASRLVTGRCFFSVRIDSGLSGDSRRLFSKALARVGLWLARGALAQSAFQLRYELNPLRLRRLAFADLVKPSEQTATSAGAGHTAISGCSIPAPGQTAIGNASWLSRCGYRPSR